MVCVSWATFKIVQQQVWGFECIVKEDGVSEDEKFVKNKQQNKENFEYFGWIREKNNQ